MATEVTHNAGQRRYEIHVDGELAGFTQAIPDGDVVRFPHTVIEKKFGGQGLAKQLIAAALDDVRAQGRTIVATCPFVQSFVDKNPQYQDLLA